MDDKLNVLVVWEMVPETTTLYLVDMTKQEYANLKQADGCYINGDGTAEQENAAMFFNWAFQEERYEGDTDHAAELGFTEEAIGLWKDCKVGSETPPFSVDKMIKTGFLL